MRGESAIGASIARRAPRSLYTPRVTLARLGSALALLLALAAWLALAQALAPGPLRAQVQGCDEDATEVRGDFEVTPEDRAEEVARNTPIVVRSAREIDLDELSESLAEERRAEQPVPCAGELLCLLETSDEPRVIDAELSVEEGNVVRLVPRDPLAASTEHTILIVQPGLDIVARSESSFETGTGSDREPPELNYGPDDVQVSVAELPPECGQGSGARRVVLSLPPASDDGDVESVQLEVELTMAKGLDEPELRARGPNDDDEVHLHFILSAEEASARVCLAVGAVDALGRSSERKPTVCFNPSTRPAFESACSIAAVAVGRRANPGGACAWLLVLLAVAARVRTRRRALRA
jgi:hypothetical protein